MILDEKQERVEAIIDNLLGTPYQHNGRSYQGVDCAGVIYLFFRELGIDLPSNDGMLISDEWYLEDPDRYINALRQLGEEVGHYRNLQPLDIPYFRLYKDVITHTAVMLDDKTFLHVLIGKTVTTDTMARRFWRRKYAGAIRLPRFAHNN